MKWIIEACPPQAKRAHKQEHLLILPILNKWSAMFWQSEVTLSTNHSISSNHIGQCQTRPSFVDTKYIHIDGCCMISNMGWCVCVRYGGWGRVCEVCFESIEIDDNTWTGWVDGEGWPAVATEPPRQCAETGGWHRWQEPRGPEMDGHHCTHTHVANIQSQLSSEPYTRGCPKLNFLS